MSQGFWKTLKKPIMALAPMADVTDAAFRKLIAKYGKPDVMWTEFVSCDGLCSDQGRPMLMRALKYSSSERPIVAQIFGANPENFYKCAKLLNKLKFDGIDINMGCPDRKVEKQGGGAKLILNPELAQEIIRQTKRGAGNLPVSVKTRIGYNKRNIEEWIKALVEVEPAVITVHARTRKEMSKVPADWQAIAEVVKIVRGSGKDILIIGNGDVKDLADAKLRVKESGADGVMIGRGIFGNPWLFNKRKRRVSLMEKLQVLVEHARLFERILKGANFEIMKKHFKAYVTGFEGAAELRAQLMQAHKASEVVKILKQNYPKTRF
jgi:nifR3 family TIM-barrel protein